jgi:hypothetical protein
MKTTNMSYVKNQRALIGLEYLVSARAHIILVVL